MVRGSLLARCVGSRKQLFGDRKTLVRDAQIGLGRRFAAEALALAAFLSLISFVLVVHLAAAL